MDIHMIKRSLSLAVILVLAISAPSVANPTNPEIAHLLQYVRESKVMFIRNGKEHQPAEAIKHMANKMGYYKDKIKNAEDFIRLCATKSLTSGEPYRVKNEDGQLEETSKWLMDELCRYRTR